MSVQPVMPLQYWNEKVLEKRTYGVMEVTIKLRKVKDKEGIFWRCFTPHVRNSHGGLWGEPYGFVMLEVQS